MVTMISFANVGSTAEVHPGLAVALGFAPVCAFYLFMVLRKKYALQPTAGMFGVALLVRAAAVAYLGVAWWSVPMMVLAGVLVVFLLLGLFGSKVSWESLWIIGALVALYPTNIGWLPLPVIFLSGLILSSIVAFLRLRAYQQSEGDAGMSLSTLIVGTGIDSGVLSMSKPDIDALPERVQASRQSLTSIAPWFLMVTVAIAAIIATSVSM